MQLNVRAGGLTKNAKELNGLSDILFFLVKSEKIIIDKVTINQLLLKNGKKNPLDTGMGNNLSKEVAKTFHRQNIERWGKKTPFPNGQKNPKRGRLLTEYGNVGRSICKNHFNQLEKLWAKMKFLEHG